MALTHPARRGSAERADPGPAGRSLWPGSVALLVGAILLMIGSQLHPRADADLDWDGAVASMLDDSAWYPSHILQFTAMLVIFWALWQIAQTPLVRQSRALLFAVGVTALGVAVHTVDLVPHTFAARELEAVRAGGSTPLLDTHLVLQAIADVVVGLGVATLAVVDAARSRRWTWFVAALAVVGGIAAAITGPLLLATQNADAATFYIGYAGVGLWLLVTAIRRVRAVSAGADVALT